MKLFKTKENLVLFLIIIIGAVVRFQALDFGLPTVYVRPDEEVIVKRAMGFFTGDLNPHFFFYPTFYLYINSLFYGVYFLTLRISGIVLSLNDFFVLFVLNPSAFHLISRAFTAISGIASIYLIYMLARKLYSKEIGILSSLFLSLSYLHMRDSHFGTTDVPLTLLIILSYLFISDILLSGKNYILAGIFSGLSASMKYNGAILAFPILAANLLCWKNTEKNHSIKLFNKKIFFSAIAMVLSFIFTSPYTLLDYKNFLKAIKFLIESEIHGIWMSLDIGWIFYLRFTLRYGMGSPLLIVSLAGILYLILRRKKEDILILSFPLMYFLLIGWSYGIYFRYMIPVLPFLSIFAAIILYEAVSLLSFFKNYKLVASFLLSIILLIPSVYNLISFNRIISMEDTRNLAVDWINRNIPSGSRIYIHGHYEYEVPPLQKGFENIKEDINALNKNWRSNPNFVKLIGLSSLVKRGNYPSKPNFHILRGESEYFSKQFLTGLRPDYIITTEYYLDYYRSEVWKLNNFIKKFCIHLKSFYPYNPQEKKPVPFFDPLDAFYVPYYRHKGIIRPGPDIHIWKVLSTAYQQQTDN